ncbi:MAG: HAMP domain-containing histidine kinase [Nocardioides sp.]|nr:HAMP domain-containing histidine kinase [Nocardioides sp.]
MHLHHAAPPEPGRRHDLRHHVLLPVILATPLLAAFLLTPQTRAVPSVALSNGLILFPVLLLSAALIHHRWLLTRDDVTAWLVLALTLVGVQGVALPALTGGRPGSGTTDAVWWAMLDLLLGVVILVCARACRVVELRCDPLVAGAGLGLGLVALRAGVLHLVPDWEVAPAGLVGLGLGVLLVHVVLALAVLEVHRAPRWLRMRVAATAVLVGISQAVAASGLPDSVASSIVVLVADALCAGLLVTTATTLLLSLMTEDSVVAELRHRLEAVEATVRVERARIHEINATLAGISSASDLIHSPATLSGPRRQMLEDMMQAELSRLTRLLQDPTPVHVVDLDEAIRHLVVAQEARGHTVQWRPTGAHALGCSDAITEVISILLDNSAQHGSPHAAIEVRSDEASVEIAVSDAGPGVPPEMRLELFEWGVHGPGSHGQGFGLHIAQQLVHEQGGSLRLQETSPRGTTFVVRFPSPSFTRHEHGATQQSA